MEAASEIYMAYVRQNLWIVLIAGLVWIVMRPAAAREPYKSAHDKLAPKVWSWNWKDQIGNQKSYAILMAPVVIWFLTFGIFATILDFVFGTT